MKRTVVKGSTVVAADKVDTAAAVKGGKQKKENGKAEG
jgi:hypothetical protein